MAIVEIAKIQIRRGQENITGIPALSPGEFGWAQDTEHLWIGKNIIEGAPDNNNTRILTENDINLFSASLSTSTVQQYVGHVPTRTSPPASSVPSSYQDKFDVIVSVLDFGASVTTSSGQLIQNAIDTLYLDGLVNASIYKESTRVALLIPAGNYTVENTLYIPPYTTLIGEGQDKTVLNLTASSSALIQFCDGTSGPGSYVVFQDGFTNILAGSYPKNINIEGITFQYNTTTSISATLPLVRADCATNSSISNCKFVGSYTTSSVTTSTNYVGIDIRGQGALTTRNLLIENCTFQNLYYGIKSNYDVENTVINDSTFDSLKRGVVFAESVAVGNYTGPLRARIESNSFNEIQSEGVYVGSNAINYPTHHIVSNNIFKEVGNNIAGDANPSTSVIKFSTMGNIAGDNYSSRFVNIYNTQSTINSTVSLIVDGHAYINYDAVYTSGITASTSTVVLASLPFNGTEESIRVDYNVFKYSANIARKGQLFISATILAGIPTATVTDTYSYTGTGDGDLEFVATLNTSSNLVQLGYTSPDAIGTITYKFSQLQ